MSASLSNPTGLFATPDGSPKLFGETENVNLVTASKKWIAARSPESDRPLAQASPSTEREIALALVSAGIAVIPIGANKVPAIAWKTHIKDGTKPEDVAAWFASSAGIGRLCGAVSGNLETIDFDVDDEVDPEYGIDSTALLTAWAEDVEEHCPGLRDRLCLIRTPRPGWHITYRCESPVEGNQKLAHAPKLGGGWKCVVETRGEGGYALCPGSPPWCHPKGGHLYHHVSGPTLENVQTITTAERAVLLQVARSFCRKPHVEREAAPTAATYRTLPGSVLPGDDFEARASWAEVLEPAGFTLVERAADGVCYWRRPGSSSKWSASTNHNGSGLFYAFSPNCGVDPDRGYNKFAVYTFLNHGGDFPAATEALRSAGYGQELRQLDHIEIDEALGLAEQKKEAATGPEPFPPHLLSVPGIVSGMTEYANATAIIPQPVLALAGALTFMGALVGRKVTDAIGTRANLYAVGLCRSGGGKDHARKVNKDFAAKAGALDLIGAESAASGAGIISAAHASPSLLFQFDEIGRLLKTVGNPGSAPHLYQIITVLMKLFTSSNTTFQGDAYADASKNLTIDCPNVNLYGTTVPGSLFESLTKENLTDGFVSRMLIFEGDDRARPRRPVRLPLPEATLDLIRQWHVYSKSEVGDIWADPVIVPYSMEADDLMWDYLESSLDLKPNEVQQAMWSRACEKARKLALIYACSESVDSPFVGVQAAEWAIGLSTYLTRRTIELAKAHVTENENERNWNRVEAIIRTAGAINATDLQRATRFLKPWERKAILSQMVESGLVTEGAKETSGRPCKMFLWGGESGEPLP